MNILIKLILSLQTLKTKISYFGSSDLKIRIFYAKFKFPPQIGIYMVPT